MKTCNKCRLEKDISEFYRHKKNSDGLAYTCKLCKKIIDSLWRESNKEKKKRINKLYRESNREKIEEWRKANSEKIRKIRQKYRRENEEKIKEGKKRYRQENERKVREQQKKWREENPEKARESSKRWRENNPGKNKESTERWRKANPYKRKAQGSKRNSYGVPHPRTIRAVYENNIKQYGTLTCYLCLQRIETGDDQLEHKIPLSRGGNHYYNNLGVACSKCNYAKNNKTVEEFLGRQCVK